MENRKLSVNEQIEHMKSKGIKFSILDEDYADKFLSNNNYPGLFNKLINNVIFRF